MKITEWKACIDGKCNLRGFITTKDNEGREKIEAAIEREIAKRVDITYEIRKKLDNISAIWTIDFDGQCQANGELQFVNDNTEEQLLKLIKKEAINKLNITF